jgi:hypothetical protein
MYPLFYHSQHIDAAQLTPTPAAIWIIFQQGRGYRWSNETKKERNLTTSKNRVKVTLAITKTRVRKSMERRLPFPKMSSSFKRNVKF